MVRRYDDPVDVRAVADEPGETTPDAFVWRGRLYVVRAVLARWHERRAWWRDPAATALLGLRADEPGGGTDVSAATGTSGATGTSKATGTTVAGECQVWRVEAAAGRSSPVGVYDLVHTQGGDTWHLARVAD
ncbi:MAG: hypothetical protein H7231_03870 [Rhodoferax sp.]|nr:hypothetical protein [Actinomycetota bacterium]